MFDPTNRLGRGTSQQFNATRLLFILIATILLLTEWSPLRAQAPIDLKPVTDTMLLEPDPENWLMWRRTLNGWGFSPLDQIDRDNVSNVAPGVSDLPTLAGQPSTATRHELTTRL